MDRAKRDEPGHPIAAHQVIGVAGSAGNLTPCKR
jgi:hypothetical protein